MIKSIVTFTCDTLVYPCGISWCVALTLLSLGKLMKVVFSSVVSSWHLRVFIPGIWKEKSKSLQFVHFTIQCPPPCSLMITFRSNMWMDYCGLHFLYLSKYHPLPHMLCFCNITYCTIYFFFSFFLFSSWVLRTSADWQLGSLRLGMWKCHKFRLHSEYYEFYSYGHTCSFPSGLCATVWCVSLAHI